MPFENGNQEHVKADRDQTQQTKSRKRMVTQQIIAALYGSRKFQQLMADHGITCSMSRAGNVWDNAAMKSFFSSLKTKRTARKV